jgi:hypothetical protein
MFASRCLVTNLSLLTLNCSEFSTIAPFSEVCFLQLLSSNGLFTKNLSPRERVYADAVA